MKSKHDIAGIARDPNLPKYDDSSMKAKLGHLSPKASLSPSGRIRILRALKAKYGENFKTYKEASDLLADYDEQHSHARAYVSRKLETDSGEDNG